MLSQQDKEFIREHLTDDVKRLALQSHSRTQSDIDFPLILRQIAGRQQIRDKLPSWYPLEDLLYPPRLSLEQCSSEATAQYKASLLSGDSLIDLTGGFGVDTALLSPFFARTVYVEKQAGLAGIAAHNFAVLGLENIEVHVADGVDYLQQTNPVNCIYLDPARRSASGKKETRIEDCEPNLLEIQDLLLEKAHLGLIKLSPMLDITSALKVLKNVHAVHVVSHENECKELLFVLKKEVQGEPSVTCVNIGKKRGIQKLTFLLSEEKQTVITYAGKVKTCLYEPNVSLLKAGCYKGITKTYPVEKLHPDSHLYTSSELLSDFPGRIFQVVAVSSLNKKELKTMLSEIDKAHISIRNFPASVADLRKRWKIKEGGDIYLFATTMANGNRVIIKTVPSNDSLSHL
jgi:16S rRNA G966 N2-methylase RsmD